MSVPLPQQPAAPVPPPGPLTQQQRDQVTELLKDLPLAQKNQRFLPDFVGLLEAMPVAQGQTIFHPDSPVEFLYMVGEGVVVQSMGTSAQPWFRKELKPGEFFGQQSLFSGKHQTRAVAAAPGVLYQMNAVSLRSLLDRYFDFQEVLLREKTGSRLRSIPLFESLSDADVRWLAQLVQEVSAAKGEELPLHDPDKRGLWIIDSGQVAVAGAAAKVNDKVPPPGTEPAWRLTAGNFFFTVQQGMRFGGACGADRARAMVDSKFLCLGDQHFNRLVGTFPQISLLIRKPLDIPGHLANVPLFSDREGMTEEHRQHLASFCAWEFVPADQNITSQGAVGYSFVYLVHGGALISAIDDQGHLRPVNLLQPGQSFGTTSLLLSEPRDATVRAVPGPTDAGQPALAGAEILNLDHRDLAVTFAERPDLWRAGVALFDRFLQEKEAQPHFSWLDEGEVVIWSDRSHPLWLIGPLGAALLALVALAVAVDEVALNSGLPLPWLIMLLLGLVFTPILIYELVNYFDDYYVVTNRRLARRDRRFLVFESRTDVPIDTVQDITVNTVLIGRIFNFGDVTIRNAAKVGPLKFTNVPDPNQVKESILREKAGALAAERGRTRATMRRNLLDELHLALTVPDLDALRALGDVQPEERLSWPQRIWRRLFAERKPKPVILPGAKRPTRLQRFIIKRLPERYSKILIGPPPPPPKSSPGEIVFRKHWVNFLQRGGLGALGSTLFVAAAGILIFVEEGAIPPDFFVAVILVWLLLLFLSTVWFAWIWVDYMNDIYVVTDEKIIDIERRPLSLSTKRRESSLDRIQTVNLDQSGFWANVLNYGDVVVRTAAADEGFTFDMVRAPRRVQQIVFQKLEGYRRKQKEREMTDRQRAIAESLQVYHDLRGDSHQGWW